MISFHDQIMHFNAWSDHGWKKRNTMQYNLIQKWCFPAFHINLPTKKQPILHIKWVDFGWRDANEWKISHYTTRVLFYFPTMIRSCIKMHDLIMQTYHFSHLLIMFDVVLSIFDDVLLNFNDFLLIFNDFQLTFDCFLDFQ